jgi:hypothetical protein
VFQSKARAILLFLILCVLGPSSFAQDDLDPFESNNKEFLKAAKESPKETDQDPVKEPETDSIIEVIKKRRDPEDDSPSRMSDIAIPLQVNDVPARPTPLLELGNPFLGTGPVSLGFKIPTGATWQPSLLIHGRLRSGVNSFRQQRGAGRSGHDDIAEWSNRLDIFANLQLAGFANERLVFGMRPIDEALKGRRFSGYRFEPNSDEGPENSFNDDIIAFFFEGDLGEIMPFLDEAETDSWDIGFSVGRQLLAFQSGIMVNDIVDAVGFTRNNLSFPWASNIRISAIYAWSQLHRNNFNRDDSADFFGLFTSMDLWVTTLDTDLAYIVSDSDTGDAFYGGFSATQRLFGFLNTTARVNLSLPTERQTPSNRRGTLLTLEGSWTPTATNDNFFFNGYLGIDRYRSALRSPGSGGPLERIGILYAAIGLGRYPAPLDNSPDRSAGASVGYQFFFGTTSRQLILEFGGRKGLTGGQNRGMLAAGARFQQAFWQRFILRLDGFVMKQELIQERAGGHMELQIQF